MTVDPRLATAVRAQLARRQPGAGRVGWKLGSGERERIGGDHVIGNLTTATMLADGATFRGGGVKLQADVEVAVELGEDLEPARYGVALEICDVADAGSVEELVVANDYHRAVAFGPFAEALPEGLVGALVVNGERRAAGPAPDDVADRVAAVARVAEAAGDGLRSGDRIITGLIVNTPLVTGDEVAAELGDLGRVHVRIA
jgi:2-keto-4-pentenoate hydratase